MYSQIAVMDVLAVVKDFLAVVKYFLAVVIKCIMIIKIGGNS